MQYVILPPPGEKCGLTRVAQRVGHQGECRRGVAMVRVTEVVSRRKVGINPPSTRLRRRLGRDARSDRRSQSTTSRRPGRRRAQVPTTTGMQEAGGRIMQEQLPSRSSLSPTDAPRPAIRGTNRSATPPAWPLTRAPRTKAFNPGRALQVGRHMDPEVVVDGLVDHQTEGLPLTLPLHEPGVTADAVERA
jgi:hypothetical protein